MGVWILVTDTGFWTFDSGSRQPNHHF